MDIIGISLNTVVALFRGYHQRELARCSPEHHRLVTSLSWSKSHGLNLLVFIASWAIGGVYACVQERVGRGEGKIGT